MANSITNFHFNLEERHGLNTHCCSVPCELVAVKAANMKNSRNNSLANWPTLSCDTSCVLRSLSFWRTPVILSKTPRCKASKQKKELSELPSGYGHY